MLRYAATYKNQCLRQYMPYKLRQVYGSLKLENL